MTKASTLFCKKLGITLPIVQAPMGDVVSPELVASVANAGGLGMIPATWISQKQFSQRIMETAMLTDGPFGINLVLSEQPEANLDVALGAGVGIVSFFWGDPIPYIDRVHEAGALVMQTVGSAEEARCVVDAGVDVVVAQGVEAGGHVWGNVASMVLVPSVVDAVPGVPVVAAGGIADGRGLAAALALGASAGWIGTRFLLSEECWAHPEYRDALLAADETGTEISTAFDDGWPNAPHRCLMNDTLENWISVGRPVQGQRPNEGEIVGYDQFSSPIPRYNTVEPSATMSGKVTSMAMYAGQSVGLVHDVKSAGTIVKDIATQAEGILDQKIGLSFTN